MKLTIIQSFAALTLASLAIACGGEGSAPAGSSKPASSAAAKSSGAPAAKSAAPSAAAASAAPSADAPAEKMELVEKDLSKAGDKFKGWVAKGPADAEVMEDLGGARIATKKVMGPGSFDLAFRMDKPKVKDLKEGATKGAEIGKGKLEWITDSADALEWSVEANGKKMYFFHIGMKVEGKDVTCYLVSPRDSEADYKLHKEACQSLAKKK
ncbi:MAG: hypothetical protein JNL21_05125 [Myxococcales bacterium]|nr:hypothetical protein [Myxococcales bacterium]